MKVPLKFQMTEFDCGPSTLVNALSFLYEREEIPAIMLQSISAFTLDCNDEDGNSGEGGTSKSAIHKLVNWFKEFIYENALDLKLEHYLNNAVTLDVIKTYIDNNGCIVLRTYQECKHYVLITGLDDEYIYIWDPYYLDRHYYDSNDNIKIVFDEPLKYNRQVTLKHFLLESKTDLSLGPINNRECVCLVRK